MLVIDNVIVITSYGLQHGVHLFGYSVFYSLTFCEFIIELREINRLLLNLIFYKQNFVYLQKKK